MSVYDTVTARISQGFEVLFTKVIDLGVNTLTGTIAQFNAALSDGEFATRDGVEVLTHKTIDLASNSVTGTAAQFNAAVSDDEFVSATGATLTSPTLVTPALGTPSSGDLTNCAHAIPDSELTTGENTFSRFFANTSTNAMTNGVMRVTYFAARKTEVITQVRTRTGSTPQVGATLARIGVYSVDASDNLVALLAATANDTALWSAGSTDYVKSFASSFTKTRGLRYAVAFLEVGTSQAANIFGTVGPEANAAARVPRISGTVSSLSDLPSSGPPAVAVGSLSASNIAIYAELLP